MKKNFSASLNKTKRTCDITASKVKGRARFLSRVTLLTNFLLCVCVSMPHTPPPIVKSVTKLQSQQRTAELTRSSAGSVNARRPLHWQSCDSLTPAVTTTRHAHTPTRPALEQNLASGASASLEALLARPGNLPLGHLAGTPLAPKDSQRLDTLVGPPLAKRRQRRAPANISCPTLMTRS